jgi:alkaline phosphatase D
MFQHGVASGDALTTLGHPVDARHRRSSNGDVTVFYEVALEDEAFTRRIARGRGDHRARHVDFTVKVDVTGLAPGHELLLPLHAARSRSRSSGARARRPRASPTMRVSPSRAARTSRPGTSTCTAASPSAPTSTRCCTSATTSTRRDGANMRAHEPAYEIITLADYRTRYSQYHRDPDLIAARRQHPFIAVWDDHETTNNAWSGGAGNHNEGEGTYEDRRAAAAQAYSEWMPIRDQVDGQDLPHAALRRSARSHDARHAHRRS